MQRCGAAQHPPCFLYQDGKMSEQQHFWPLPFRAGFLLAQTVVISLSEMPGVLAGFPKATDEVGCCSWRLSVLGEPDARGRLLI